MVERFVKNNVDFMRFYLTLVSEVSIWRFKTL